MEKMEANVPVEITFDVLVEIENTTASQNANLAPLVAILEDACFRTFGFQPDPVEDQSETAPSRWTERMKTVQNETDKIIARLSRLIDFLIEI